MNALSYGSMPGLQERLLHITTQSMLQKVRMVEWVPDIAMLLGYEGLPALSSGIFYADHEAVLLQGTI